ncbi:hypothetical protein TNIN_379111 [Trichonephila inaurata madagascariensis]|uniref:Uncharacterized protein n=1 Tax=Trichonephila inaurata madagascariensis TaxID=2747483 RepID=A0A8X7BVC5_9ARAC|nr:hypothetical protein TNIN_379111 [Trichonephila inaurata madagascariensis]
MHLVECVASEHRFRSLPTCSASKYRYVKLEYELRERSSHFRYRVVDSRQVHSPRHPFFDRQASFSSTATDMFVYSWAHALFSSSSCSWWGEVDDGRDAERILCFSFNHPVMGWSSNYEKGRSVVC